MATSIIPKSEARYCNALIHHFAELPAVEMDDGTICWALPGGRIICDKEEALEEAEKLDIMIQSNIKRTGRVLH